MEIGMTDIPRQVACSSSGRQAARKESADWCCKCEPRHRVCFKMKLEGLQWCLQLSCKRKSDSL